jgi:membrane protein implicated in regulation of membrane protease activity
MEILALAASYGAWTWIVAGLVLLALELVVPGGVFVWLGVAAIVTGIVSFIWPLGWAAEFAVFAVLALIAIFSWLRFRPRGAPSDRPFLNRRAEAFIGHEAILDEPIVDGFGRLALGDAVGRIWGPDLAAGSRIRVTGADGAVLKVERLG